MTWQSVRALLPVFSEADAAQRTIDRFLGDAPGGVAILTPDNTHRPLSRDSAIFKGGTNVSESPIWGASPLVASLVPERHYFFPALWLQTPIDLAPYRYVLFVSLEGIEITKARLIEEFGASLIGFECPLQLQVSDQVQYACQRVPDAPIDETPGDIAFAASPAVLDAGLPVAWASRPRRPLRAGEMAYVAGTGEIWRLEQSGEFVRMRGSLGQTVRVEALGRWSEARHATVGSLATYDGTRWSVNDRSARPMNRNSTLRMREDRSIRGWDILARDEVTIDRRNEVLETVAPEGWLEFRARIDGARVGVRAGLDTDDIADGPVTAVVTARAFSQGMISARIGDARPGTSTMAMTRDRDDRRQVVALGRWETFVIRVEPDQLQGDRLAITVELLDGRAGDRFDIGRIELYAGRYPYLGFVHLIDDVREAGYRGLTPHLPERVSHGSPAERDCTHPPDL